jgi:hypothetical protein
MDLALSVDYLYKKVFHEKMEGKKAGIVLRFEEDDEN